MRSYNLINGLAAIYLLNPARSSSSAFSTVFSSSALIERSFRQFLLPYFTELPSLDFIKSTTDLINVISVEIHCIVIVWNTVPSVQFILKCFMFIHHNVSFLFLLLRKSLFFTIYKNLFMQINLFCLINFSCQFCMYS